MGSGYYRASLKLLNITHQRQLHFGPSCAYTRVHTYTQIRVYRWRYSHREQESRNDCSVYAARKCAEIREAGDTVLRADHRQLRRLAVAVRSRRAVPRRKRRVIYGAVIRELKRDLADRKGNPPCTEQ